VNPYIDEHQTRIYYKDPKFKDSYKRENLNVSKSCPVYINIVGQKNWAFYYTDIVKEALGIDYPSERIKISDLSFHKEVKRFKRIQDNPVDVKEDGLDFIRQLSS
jgi:Iap family predicted aminopeptidase